jgi:hypothetical protein
MSRAWIGAFVASMVKADVPHEDGTVASADGDPAIGGLDGDIGVLSVHLELASDAGRLDWGVTTLEDGVSGHVFRDQAAVARFRAQVALHLLGDDGAAPIHQADRAGNVPHADHSVPRRRFEAALQISRLDSVVRGLDPDGPLDVVREDAPAPVLDVRTPPRNAHVQIALDGRLSLRKDDFEPHDGAARVELEPHSVGEGGRLAFRRVVNSFGDLNFDHGSVTAEHVHLAAGVHDAELGGGGEIEARRRSEAMRGSADQGDAEKRQGPQLLARMSSGPGALSSDRTE